MCVISRGAGWLFLVKEKEKEMAPGGGGVEAVLDEARRGEEDADRTPGEMRF